MERENIIKDEADKKSKEPKNEEIKKEIKSKQVIFSSKMTTKEIIKIAGKPKEVFHTKKELCSLLERQGYTIVK